jgi:hypothetical protein
MVEWNLSRKINKELISRRALTFLEYLLRGEVKMVTSLMSVIRNAGLRAVALLALVALVSASEAWAQPRAFFQSGTPVGLDNRLNVARVPVRNSAGVIKYYDVALTFNVDATGKLTVNNAATKITLSPELVVGAFRPGIYEQGSLGCRYQVGAPGVLGGGRITGSLGGSLNCGSELDVSWVSGPIAGHPNEGALQAAGITFQGYSWGVVGETSWGGWGSGDLVGVVQSGQNLVIHNFGDDNKEDSSAVFVACPSCS